MKKKTETFKYVSWADTMKKSDITGTPKEEVKATLEDVPFAMARAEANKLMSYRYNPTRGTYMNDNGDETKDAKVAVKYNKELDDVFGPQNQVSETKAKIQKKIFPNKKPQKRNYWEHFRKTGKILEPTKEEIARTKGPSTWKIIYDSMTPYEKGQWNLEKRKQGMDGRTGDPLPKEKAQMPTPVVTPTIVPVVNVVPEEKVEKTIVAPVLPPKEKLGLEGAWEGDIVYERRLNSDMLPKTERTLERIILNREDNNDR